MLANPSVPTAPFRVRPKYALFALIGVMTVYVLVVFERFLIDPAHPQWAHYAPIKWWIYPHALAGTCTMLVAPLQFSDRLRKKYTKVHRVLGRVYIGGVFVLAPLGAYLQYVAETTFGESGGATRSFTVLAGVNMVLLIVPTSIALMHAMLRNITLHRQWMIRSYAVALVFFEGRFVSGVTGVLTGPLAEAIIWSCLALSLLFADLIIHWQDRRRAA
jgi:hypothetical protein